MVTTTPGQKRHSLKDKLEAILFSVAGRITLKDLCRLARNREEKVLAALQELQKGYEERDTALHLTQDGDYWKLSVRDELHGVTRKIVTETELSKTVLETLAVIAFKYPIKQSDLINIRTNKAYDHLKELEGQGFITRKKHGRTNLIKLTDKFFQYFDLPPDKLRDQFTDFSSIAQAIAKKEDENKAAKEQQKQEKEDVEDQEERIKQEIDNLEEEPLTHKEGNTEKWGDLEVFEEENIPETDSKAEDKVDDNVISSSDTQETNEEDEKEEQDVQEKETTEELTDQEKTQEEEQIQEESSPENEGREDPEAQEESEPEIDNQEVKEEPIVDLKEGEGIPVTPEMEKEIDKRVDELMHPQPEKDAVEKRHQELFEVHKKKRTESFKEVLEKAKQKKEEESPEEEKDFDEEQKNE